MSARQNIVLIGFMGSGKSSIGRLIARQFGFQFVDTDAVIAERAGVEIAGIFEREGEEHFRALETAALESLLLLQRCVIATGGGVVLRERNRELLRELGSDPRETVAKLLVERQPCYEAAAQWTLDTSRLSHGQAAAAVIAEARRAFAWQGGA